MDQLQRRWIAPQAPVTTLPDGDDEAAALEHRQVLHDRVTADLVGEELADAVDVAAAFLHQQVEHATTQFGAEREERCVEVVVRHM